MRKYINDYEVVIQEDEKGRKKRVAVYKGDYYEINIDEPTLKKFRRNSLILIGLVVVAQIAAGFIGNLGMYTFFVSLPYVLSFLPLYFLVDGAARLPKEKRDFRRDEVELIFKRMKIASIILLVLLGVGILGEIIFLIWFSAGFISREIIFLAVEIVAMIAVFLLIRMQKPIKVTRILSEQVRIEDDAPMDDEA